MTESSAALIAAVERTRATVLDSVARLSETQASYKPSGGGWSVAEILEHLYLAEISGISKICTAVDSVRLDVKWTAAKPNAGKHIEQVVAETWKEKEIAPPIATPHIGGPLWFWMTALKSLTPVLSDLGTRLRGLNPGDVVFPHFLSGPLDAAQRLEFLRWHMERHLGQIQHVMNEGAFPK